jgi:hypothetical protein
MEVHMRWPLRFRGFVPIVLSLSIAAATGAACSSGENAEAGAVGTTATGGLAVTFSQTYLTVENRTGVPIVEGELQIMPRGVMPPFRASLPRIEGSGRRDLSYNQFRSKDGTPFRRGATRARTVRIIATDLAGKKLEQEVPFD